MAFALLVLGLSATVLPVATSSAAPVQDTTGSTACFPGSDPDYPPTGDGVSINVNLRLEGGQFTPGGSGTVTLSGAVPNSVLCGTAFSTPITLPAKQADANGRVVYTNLAVPADFELNAEHHIDVFSLQQRVGSFDFCVNRSGAITALGTCGGTKPGKLAKTGTDRTFDLAKAGLLGLGVGATALYVRRRRLRNTAA